MLSLQQAMVNVGQRIPLADKSVSARLDRAYEILTTKSYGYTVQPPLRKGQPYRIVKASTSALNTTPTVYHVTKLTCDCPDFEKARGNLCKHRLAVMLYEEMQNGKS